MAVQDGKEPAPQPQREIAQLLLDAQTDLFARHMERGERIVAVHHDVVILDVQELRRKDNGGGLHLGGSQDQGRHVDAAASNAQGRADGAKRGGGGFVEQHDDIDVAFPRPIAPARHPTVQHQPGKVRAGGAHQIVFEASQGAGHRCGQFGHGSILGIAMKVRVWPILEASSTYRKRKL